jgi:hypothetical protein
MLNLLSLSRRELYNLVRRALDMVYMDCDDDGLRQQANTARVALRQLQEQEHTKES